jgi:hypothetical protein
MTVWVHAWIVAFHANVARVQVDSADKLQTDL